jgi:sec-independent protein translocase protein TatC
VSTKEERRAARTSPDSMTLAGHLLELRRRLIVAVTAICLMGVLAFLAYDQLLSFLKHPYCVAYPKHCDLYVTGPLVGLSLRFKIAAFGGLLLASPVVLWELWRFITPGLKSNEKRYAIPFIISAIVLFLGGCALAYYSYEHALIFLHNIGGPLIPIYSPDQYINLLLLMMFLFGITFLFPVVLVSLELAGVVTPAALLRSWRWAVIIITVAAAVFTPTGDPISMLLLMAPLIVFYFVAILIGKLFGR